MSVEIFTPDEMNKIFSAAHNPFRVILALSAFAGLRSAEVLRLDWSEIDLNGGMIEIKAEKTKTASRRLVPVLPNLKAWLEPHAKKKGRVWELSAPEFHRRQREAAIDAGLTWKSNGLRHSFFSYRVASIQHVAQVALEAGNSPQMIFSNYRELVKPAAAAERFAITPDAIKTASDAAK